MGEDESQGFISPPWALLKLVGRGGSSLDALPGKNLAPAAA